MNDINNQSFDNNEISQLSGQEKRNQNNKILILFVMAIVFIACALAAFNALFSQRTEDAVVESSIITAASKVDGYIASVNAKIGDEVKANRLLAEIDTQSFENVLRIAENKLSDSKSKLSAQEKLVSESISNVNSSIQKRNAAASKLSNAEADYTKSAQMYKEGIISKQEYDNVLNVLTSVQGEAKFAEENLKSAKSILENNKQKLQTLESEIKLAEEDIKRAKTNLSNTKIYAPEEGKVSSILAKEGDYILISQPILEITPKKIWILATFDEKRFAIMVGQKAQIKIPACKNKTFKGHVESVHRATGENIKGALVKILVDDDTSAENIVSGMQAIPTVKKY